MGKGASIMVECLSNILEILKSVPGVQGDFSPTGTTFAQGRKNSCQLVGF